MEHANTTGKSFWILVIALSVVGFLTGFFGFRTEGEGVLNSAYSTFQLFILHHSFEGKINTCWLEWSRWIIFGVFLLLTFQLFITIVAPRFIQYAKIQFFYSDHIIICGLNKITVSLVEKYPEKQIVVLVEEANKYAETLKAKGAKLLTGDFTDPNFLRKAKLKRASKLFAIIDNDKINVKIAHSVFSCLENRKRRKDALKCFILIKDRELKTLLEESLPFKYKTATFDGIPFNINELGIKYGIAANIDKILPKEIKTPPEILLIGLTEKTEMALLNLAQGLTMQRETFRFTIVEKNTRKIRFFKRKYAYIQDFAEIKISNEIKSEQQFDSVLVCSDNPIEAMKQAVAIRYLLGRNEPNILVFCEEADTFTEVLQNELEKKRIFLINLFGQMAGYVFELDKSIEEKAKEAHYFWNTLYNQNKEWDAMTGHFKQSNRNQILDNYLRMYMARGEKFEDFKNRLISFSDDEKETLAMMEHRRWMIEKYDNGWMLGKRDNELKRHDCLVPWEELPTGQQAKDYDVINLMIKLINNQTR